jgi:hypothetical protein
VDSHKSRTGPGLPRNCSLRGRRSAFAHGQLDSCEECSSHHGLVVSVLWPQGTALEAQDGPTSDVHIRTLALAAYANAHDLCDGEANLVQRPTRIVERAWILSVLPEKMHRDLLCRMLFYVRRGDRPEGTAWPVKRWGELLGMSSGRVYQEVEYVRGRLLSKRPGFVEQNLDAPLAMKLARHQTDNPDDFSR